MQLDQALVSCPEGMASEPPSTGVDLRARARMSIRAGDGRLFTDARTGPKTATTNRTSVHIADRRMRQRAVHSPQRGLAPGLVAQRGVHCPPPLQAPIVLDRSPLIGVLADE